MNLYARPIDLRRAMDIDRYQPNLTEDQLEILLAAVSREMDNQLGRHFYTKTETRYFMGQGSFLDPSDSRVLWLGDDIVSASSVKVDTDDDGTYELTLTASDYRLGPDNGAYKCQLVLDRNSENLSYWVNRSRYLEVVGIWGYSQEAESVTTLGAAVSTTTETTFTLSDSSTIDRGDTLLVGSEQVYVSAKSGDDVTVTRGLNGTTAATHDSGDAVSRRLFPRDLRLAVIEETTRIWREQATGYAGTFVSAEGGGFNFRGTYPHIKALIDPYRKRVIA